MACIFLTRNIETIETHNLNMIEVEARTSCLFHTSFVLLTLLTLLTCINTVNSWNTQSPEITFRPGMKSDEIRISVTMAKNLMNPLNIDSKRFLVAVDPMNDKKLYGWAQLRPIGSNRVDPDRFDSAPGSGSIERDVDVDEEIWDDFENDPMEFPVGFASLPWTKEYREFSKGAERRRRKREELVRMVEEEEKDKNQLWELASVYVLPEWRRRGIGGELIRRIMQRHVLLGRNVQDVYLLTLDSTKDWYASFGFGLTDDPPASMAFEVAAGGVITKVIGEELIAMRMRGGQCD